MIRKEQQLRDKTYCQGQDQRRGQRGQLGQQGQQGQQGDPNAFGELRENQQALREQLKKLLEEIRRRRAMPDTSGRAARTATLNKFAAGMRKIPLLGTR
jgi:hypothetical protein